ncbi:MAG: hypothetical protein M3164_01305 [Actinomycetota bacterium]|nr:hypothetical protein [Actinomycetota bacterium]
MGEVKVWAVDVGWDWRDAVAPSSFPAPEVLAGEQPTRARTSKSKRMMRGIVLLGLITV